MTQSPDLSTRLAAAVEAMPAFPASVRRILTLTRDAGCAPKDLVQVIRNDPVITVRVLRVVNSAYYGLAQQMTSIDHAVVFLGFNTIKNLALSIAAISMMPSNPLAGFDGQRYLQHSLLVAGLARQLAQGPAQADPHDAFIAGLLHDFGKVVVAQFMPVEFRRAFEMSLWQERALHLTLHAVLGADPAEVAAMLAEKWRFAAELVQTLRHQHRPEQWDTAMTACVFAANQIAKRLGHDYGAYCQVLPLPDAVAARLGGGLEAVQASLGDTRALLAESTLFAHL
ncbi:MAG: hypothetical protein Fur007_06340 [Rhodoferax sp.]